MKKLTALTSLTLLLIGCGGAGSGSGDLATTSLIKKVEQDLVCCAYWDEGNNTCAQYEASPTKTIVVSIKEAEVSQEFDSNNPLIFEDCKARFIPNPNLPQEAKEPSLIKKMNNYLYCTATDIPPGGSGSVEITYSQSLLQDILFPLWQKLNGKTLAYTIEAVVKYKQGDKDYTKVIRIPVDFDNFVNGENDMCQ
jgi:hypothetical protein